MLPSQTIFFSVLLTGILAIAPCLGNCDGFNHSAIYGHRQQGDQLVCQERIVACWKFLGYATRDLSYPLRGQDQVHLTYIEIIDNYNNGHGGCPYIVEGGVGHDTVTIHILSEFNRGFDFDIKIYGV